MPWWVQILVDLAIKLGLPWLLKAFPWIPASIVSEIEKLIDELNKAKQAHRAHRRKRIREVKSKLCM